MIKDLWNKITQLIKKDRDLTKESWDGNTIFNAPENKPIGNDAVGKKQEKFLVKVLVGVLVSILGLIFIFTAKEQKKAIAAQQPLKIETADGSLDTEKMWRNHLEGKINNVQTDVELKLKQGQEEAITNEKKLLDEIKLEMAKVQEQVAFAKEELQGASLELNRALNVQQELNAKEPLPEISNTTSHLLRSDTEYDEPKNSRYYIPETTYLTGYLLGGLAVSTAMSAPDSNTTPVVIRITNRGNLPKKFSVDVATCKILGSSYGDLSSERAIVRLEKMVCIDPKTELVTTTSVAGTLYGDDGANGIKGTVVSTGSKHIKSAMMGGIISGLGQSARGQEALTISPMGVAASGKQTMVDMLKKGAFAGAGNAADKVADYYLKMAESTSPILSVPAGARVQVMFLKGFHIGELKTHAKIAKERNENKKQNNTAQTQNNNTVQPQENWSDE